MTPAGRCVPRTEAPCAHLTQVSVVGGLMATHGTPMLITEKGRLCMFSSAHTGWMESASATRQDAEAHFARGLPTDPTRLQRRHPGLCGVSRLLACARIVHNHSGLFESGRLAFVWGYDHKAPIVAAKSRGVTLIGIGIRFGFGGGVIRGFGACLGVARARCEMHRGGCCPQRFRYRGARRLHVHGGCRCGCRRMPKGRQTRAARNAGSQLRRSDGRQPSALTRCWRAYQVKYWPEPECKCTRFVAGSSACSHGLQRLRIPQNLFREKPV